MTELAIVFLVALVIATNVFWAYVCLKLTNRLMSRNFYEFKQADTRPAIKTPKLKLEEKDEFAESQARELNSIMGMA